MSADGRTFWQWAFSVFTQRIHCVSLLDAREPFLSATREKAAVELPSQAPQARILSKLYGNEVRILANLGSLYTTGPL